MKVREIIRVQKGRPPKKGDHAAIEYVYLTPEYLRGKEGAQIIEAANELVHVDENEILLLWDGSNAGEFFKSKKGALSSTMVRIAFDKNAFDTDFLFYQFKYIEPVLKSKTSGSGIPHVDKNILGDFDIEQLERKEQEQIAEILSYIDHSIQQTESLIAKYQRIKTGLMQDLLTKGIDEKGNIRSEQTHAFKDSPLGRIPVEWEVKSIGEITSMVGSGVTPTGGSNVYGTEGIIFLRSQNIYHDGLYLDDVAFITEEINSRMLRSEVKNYDVLLNITGASIGRCCPVPVDFPKANVNQHVCIIRLCNHTETDAFYVSSVISSEIGQLQIKAWNAGGNREGLNYQQVRNLLIPYPGEEERIRFINKAKGVNEWIATEEQTLNKLHRIKTGLMQDLLTGRVRVTGLMKETNPSQYEQTLT